MLLVSLFYLNILQTLTISGLTRQQTRTGIYKSPRDAINGACPPAIIHTEQVSGDKDDADKKSYNATESDKFFFNPRFWEGLSDPGAGPKDFFEKKNPCGFMVRATKNGSMTQDIFFWLLLSFCKALTSRLWEGRTACHPIFWWSLITLEYSSNPLSANTQHTSLFPSKPHFNLGPAERQRPKHTISQMRWRRNQASSLHWGEKYRMVLQYGLAPRLAGLLKLWAPRTLGDRSECNNQFLCKDWFSSFPTHTTRSRVPG